jgi:hypothetical protein
MWEGVGCRVRGRRGWRGGGGGGGGRGGGERWGGEVGERGGGACSCIESNDWPDIPIMGWRIQPNIWAPIFILAGAKCLQGKVRALTPVRNGLSQRVLNII